MERIGLFMNREYLKEKFKEAKENKCDICVEVTIPGQDDTEYIINKYNSLDNKLKYYLKAYDENLAHSMNDHIRMVKIFCLNFYMGGNE